MSFAQLRRDPPERLHDPADDVEQTSQVPAPWTSFGGEYIAWKQVVVWGTHLAWGNTIATNQQAWGSVVVWGTSDVMLGDVVVWGTDLVRADPQSWANVVVWGTDYLGVIMGDVVVWGVTTGLTPETTAWGELEGASSSSTGMVSAYAIR